MLKKMQINSFRSGILEKEESFRDALPVSLQSPVSNPTEKRDSSTALEDAISSVNNRHNPDPCLFITAFFL
ncbi:hypothetical protein JTE90_023121 [Oedothorax gibbosus]|uniref:Uncharacterized protein n=1 Tax=Oedothorax gibbosus TaxID=931172 RepID=A0AAV6UM86_9ARAC|nr:hypothetical protein JTE90_023121 [Oedothorax gibbosus]